MTGVQTCALPISDKFVNISMGKRRTGALECKICQMSVKFGFHRSCKSFNALMILEVYRIGRTHFLSEFQTFFFSVYSYDMIDSHRTENGDTNQADRTAALYLSLIHI